MELKHIVGYLPYGLKGALSSDCQEEFSELIDLIEDESKFKKNAVWEYSGYADGSLCIPLGEGELDGFLMSHGSTYACFKGVCNVKPILRPLYDLTKEIEVKGKIFIPAEYFWSIDLYDQQAFELYGTIPPYWKACLEVDIRDLDWGVVQKLYEWHFDIHDLIEKGLAIDINTLK